MIRSEGDTRICAGHGQRDRARDIAHQPAIVENKHRAGNGSADVCGLDASGTKKERSKKGQSKTGKRLESPYISLL